MSQAPGITKPEPFSPITSSVTPGVSTSDAVSGISTGVSWSLAAGAGYLLHAVMSASAAAGTTGVQFALIRSGGLTFTTVELTAIAMLTGLTSEVATVATAAADGFTTGANSMGATARPVVIHGYLLVNAGGTATLQMRSEVGGSAVTLARGAVTLTKVF